MRCLGADPNELAGNAVAFILPGGQEVTPAAVSA